MPPASTNGVTSTAPPPKKAPAARAGSVSKQAPALRPSASAPPAGPPAADAVARTRLFVGEDQQASPSQPASRRSPPAMKEVVRFQTTAEDLFLSMSDDTDDDGEAFVVDEGSKLLMLCSQLLFRDLKQGTYENIKKLRTFLRRKPRAGCGDKFSFDEFIELYNEYVIEGWKAPPSYRAAPSGPVTGSPN
jgi:hypothetical protein